MSPDPKNLLRDSIMGLYILTKIQIDTTLLTPSKVDVTELLGGSSLVLNQRTILLEESK